MTQTQKLLRELIALPSVNCALLPPNHPRAGEKRVVDFLTATAAAAGLDVDVQKVFPDRCNLLARLSPAGDLGSRVQEPVVPFMGAGHGDEQVVGLACLAGRASVFLRVLQQRLWRSTGIARGKWHGPATAHR